MKYVLVLAIALAVAYAFPANEAPAASPATGTPTPQHSAATPTTASPSAPTTPTEALARAKRDVSFSNDEPDFQSEPEPEVFPKVIIRIRNLADDSDAEKTHHVENDEPLDKPLKVTTHVSEVQPADEKTTDSMTSSPLSDSLMSGSGDLVSNLLNGGSLLSNLPSFMHMLTSKRDEDPNMHPIIKRILFMRRTVITPEDSSDKDDDEPVIKRITYTRIIRLIKMNSGEDGNSGEDQPAKMIEHSEHHKSVNSEEEKEEKKPIKKLEKTKEHIKSAIVHEDHSKPSETNDSMPSLILIHHPMSNFEQVPSEGPHVIIHQKTPGGEKTITIRSASSSQDHEPEHVDHKTTIHAPLADDDDDEPHIIIHHFRRSDDDTKPPTKEPMVLTHHIIHVPTEQPEDSSELSPIRLVHLKELLPATLFGDHVPSLFGDDAEPKVHIVRPGQDLGDAIKGIKEHAAESGKGKKKVAEHAESTNIPAEVIHHKNSQDQDHHQEHDHEEHPDDLMELMNHLMSGLGESGDHEKAHDVAIPTKLRNTSEQLKKDNPADNDFGMGGFPFDME